MHFSIVIPTLNEEKYIGGILESLLNQTYRNFEVLVVDAPSKDKTKDVVLSFIPKFSANNITLKYIKSTQGGVSFQRNYGVFKSKYAYILFFDADTLIEPVFIEKINVFLENNPKVDIVTCWNIPISKRKRDKMFFWAFNRLYLEGNKKINPIAVGTFMGIKKEPFLSVGGFSSEIVLAEDFDLVSRMYKKGCKYALLRDPVIYFSVRRYNYMGRIPYFVNALKAGIYYYIKGPIKNPKLIDYKMDGSVR